MLEIGGGDGDASLGLEEAGEETTALDKRRLEVTPDNDVLAESVTPENKDAIDSFLVGDPDMTLEVEDEEDEEEDEEE